MSSQASAHVNPACGYTGKTMFTLIVTKYRLSIHSIVLSSSKEQCLFRTVLITIPRLIHILYMPWQPQVTCRPMKALAAVLAARTSCRPPKLAGAHVMMGYSTQSAVHVVCMLAHKQHLQHCCSWMPDRKVRQFCYAQKVVLTVTVSTTMRIHQVQKTRRAV